MAWPDEFIRIRIALDADRTVDWTTWDWEDISEYGREAGQITIQQGDADEFGDTPPATCSLRLDNTDGRFWRRKADGPYYGRFGRNTPIWIEVDPGTGYETRFLGEVAEWPKRWDITATDATVPIECAGVSRRLGQNDAEVQSAATRYLAASGPVALWPLEDGEDATSAASGLPGGLPMSVWRGTLDFDSDAPPGASGSAKPSANAANALIGVVAGASASAWQAAIWTKGAPANLAADAYYIPMEIRTSNGRIFRWVMQHDDDVSMPAVGVGYYAAEDDSAATEFVGWFDPTPEAGFYTRMNEWVLIQFVAVQNGANLDVELYVNGELEDSATWSSVTAGAPVRVNAPGRFGGIFGIVSENMEDIWLSEISIHNGGTVVDQYQAGIGFGGEGAADRIIRLFGEDGVPITVIGAELGEPMAVQGSGSVMALARAAETADVGTLQDNPTEPGLLYIPRAERYNLTPWELDVADADVADAPEATDDDQRIGNQVTATRPGGGTYVARDEDDIAAYGIVVDDPISPAVWQDSQLPHQAGWRLNLDQVDEDRWPKISLDFARRPELIADWVTVLPGVTRVRIAGMPDQTETEPVDVIIEGWTETISQTTWRVDLFCSPASPWTVGEVEDPELGRADTDGTQLRAQLVSGTDTTVQIAVADGPAWITRATSTYAAMFPFDVRTSGVVLRVLAAGQVLNSNPWFEANVGGWQATTGATIAHSTAQAHSGAGSMLITPDGVTAIVGATVTQAANAVVAAGVDYLIAGWLRSSGAVSDARMAIDWYQSNGTTFISSTLPSSIALSAGVWTYYATVVTSPALAARARLRVRLAGTPSGSIWADECVLIPVGSYAGPGDNFTRSVAAGSWGTSSTGHAWSINSGTAANWSVTGTVGRVATATINQLELATIDVGSVDHDPRCEFVLPVVPTGAGFTIRVVARYVDTSNYYQAEVLITTGAVAELRLYKRVAGVSTQLGNTVTLSPAHVAGDRWILQCSAIGSTIRARAWKSGQPEERGWHITSTDTALTSGTRVGVACRRETSNTNGSTNVDFDNVAVPSLQVMTIETTPVNGVAKTIAAGEPPSLATPWRLAL